jgi:flagellar motor switch protein FliM
MSLRVFDFREIAALDDTAVAFRNWIAKSTSYFSDFWVEATGYGAQVKLGSITTDSFHNVLRAIPRDDLCCVAAIEGKMASVWCITSAELKKLFCEFLGMEPAEDVSDGELTAFERDLSALFIEQLAKSIGEGWMGAEDLAVKPSPLEKDPRKLRLFREKDLITKTSLEIELKHSSVKIDWLLPKQQTSALLETVIDQRAAPEAATPSPELIGRMPVELVAILGHAKVPVTQLADLEPGQLIMLDQRIDEPVSAFVNDTKYFECWPGQVGKNQALKIDRRLES